MQQNQLSSRGHAAPLLLQGVSCWASDGDESQDRGLCVIPESLIISRTVLWTAVLSRDYRGDRAKNLTSRSVRTREATRQRPENRALRLPVNAHLRWLYVHREDLDLGAVQTAATGCSKMMFLIGLVLRHHSAGKANIRAVVRLRRSSCLLVLQDTLCVRHIRLVTSLWREHDFLFFLTN